MEISKSYKYFLEQAAKTISLAVEKSTISDPTKSFMHWLLDESNLHLENYLRMMGVAGSIELELKLFNKVLPPDLLNDMAPFISHLNAYFAYETLSDNLGVGLGAGKKNSNPAFAIQVETLLHFNEAMISKINGEEAASNFLLSPITEQARHISVNNQTLAPDQMQAFITDFLKNHPEISATELEHSFLAILTLNIETCLQLLESLVNSPIHGLLKQSLTARYDSVTQIVKNSANASWEQLAEWGLHSILVVPTLAYCIGALDEVSPYANIQKVVDNGLLYSAMADAALLTRLLNDIGTRLLEADFQARQDWQQKFKNYNQKNCNNIYEYLYQLAKREEFFLPLTRIRKDIQHGEFNVSLDNLASMVDLTQAINKFCEGIDYYAKLYQKTYKRLLNNLAQLTAILGNEMASKIILHFVQFHQYKYSFEFESMRGDYAVTTKPEQLYKD